MVVSDLLPSVLSQKVVDKAPGEAGGPSAEHAGSQPAPGTRKERVFIYLDLDYAGVDTARYPWLGGK